MILNSVTSAVAFPTEELVININDVSPGFDNIRTGVRFTYQQYNNVDKFLNNPSYSLVSDATEVGFDNNLYQPTTSACIPRDFPVTWTINHTSAPTDTNHFLYLTFLGGASAITVHPTQPYPIITKIENNSISVTGGVVPFQSYEGEVTKDDFRQTLPLSVIKRASEFGMTYTLSTPYASKSRRNFLLSNTKNASNVLRTVIDKNIIDNSFNISVPIISAKDQIDYTWDTVLYNKASPIISLNTGSITLTSLPSEELSQVSGVTAPFFASSPSLNLATGALNLVTKPPLLIAANAPITCTYETYLALSNPQYTLASSPGTNIFSISTVNPIYFYNYKFNYSGTGITNRDAYTISFYPSAGITATGTSDSYGTSSVYVSTIFNDNYFQTSYPIEVNSTKLKKRFIERSDDYSLSAFDVATNILYRNNQWMPGSAVMRFINDGLGNNYTAGIQLSSQVGAIYNCVDDVNFILNNKKIVFSLYLTEFDDVSARAKAVLFPYPDPELLIKWDAFPPENVSIKDVKTGADLELNTYYPAGDIEVDFYNLGVDKTQLILYSQEFDVSGSTYWFPSSSVIGDVYLEIKHDMIDVNPTNVGEISAFFNRRGFLYRVPVNANIIWSELTNSTRGSIVFNTYDNTRIIEESTIYPSTLNYSIMNASVSTLPVIKNPPRITFNISCNVFDEDYSIQGNRLIYFRSYPEKTLLSMLATSGVGNMSSINIDNIVISTSGVWSLSAQYPDLIVDSVSSIHWRSVNSNGLSLTGMGDTFSLTLSTLSAQVSLSAGNATPFAGNFKSYNFYDTLNFHLIPTVTPLDYIGFPEFKYDSANKTLLTYNTRTASQGMTSYKPCHTENFLFSATPGFDTYKWTIGDLTVNTSSNTVTIPVNYSNVSASGLIQLSAFNDIFIPSDAKTIYNFTSSDNSSKYKQHISFIDYQDSTVSLTLNNNLYNTAKYSSRPLMSVAIDTNDLSLNSFNICMVLSGQDSVQTQMIGGNTNNFSKQFKADIQNSDFIIPENSFNVMNLYLSGNVNVTYGNGFCSVDQPISSTVIPLSVFNGPNLDIYTEKNLVSSGEVVYFYNRSNENFISNAYRSFTAFTFDNGEGSLVSSTSDTISTTYISTGVYTPMLTGFLTTGDIVTASWADMVCVHDSFDSYDSNILTEFYANFSLPYNLANIKIAPNSWQYASVINNSFDKLKTDLEFLSSRCAAYNTNYPTAFGGYLGTKFGNFKWITNYDTVGIDDDVFTNLKCGTIVGNRLICMNNSNLEIFNISENPSKLYSSSKINKNEIFNDVVKIHYSNNRLYILDRGRKTFFVLSFDVDSPESSELTHYWSGIGDRLGRTKFNDPIDFVLDAVGNIYILDRASYVIKVYNKNLNWIKNIEIEGLSPTNYPTSIDINDDIMVIASNSGYSYICNLDGVVANTIYVDGASRAILNKIHTGILYIICGYKILKYMHNGVYVSEETLSHYPSDILFDNYHNYTLTSNFVNKTIDFVSIDRLLTGTHALLSSWTDVYINENEFVTDYIFNDSFKKIRDKINILNSNISYRYLVDLDPYSNILSQSLSSYNASDISNISMIGTNEPVLYDTINRGIEELYNCLLEFKTNMDIVYNYPNNNDDIMWRWKYHYIDGIQRPSLNKNPVSWRELKSSKIGYNPSLSAASSWWTIREGLGGNHSEICWNYQYLRDDSYFPLEWHDTEQFSVSGHVFTWEQLESDCCAVAETVFDDCNTICK